MDLLELHVQGRQKTALASNSLCAFHPTFSGADILSGRCIWNTSGNFSFQVCGSQFFCHVEANTHMHMSPNISHCGIMSCTGCIQGQNITFLTSHKHADFVLLFMAESFVADRLQMSVRTAASYQSPSKPARHRWWQHLMVPSVSRASFFTHAEICNNTTNCRGSVCCMIVRHFHILSNVFWNCSNWVDAELPHKNMAEGSMHPGVESLNYSKLPSRHDTRCVFVMLSAIYVLYT